MSRRAAAWLLSLPLMLGGTEVAHWLVYRLVYPDPAMRAQVLASTGHGYMSEAPIAAGIAGALILAAFWRRMCARGPESPSSSLRLGTFIALPPLAFALQECVETMAVGHSPFSAVYAPTFLPGLLVQLPFVVLAYLAARALLRGADHLNRVLGSSRPDGSPDPNARTWSAIVAAPARLRWWCGLGERAPPVLASRV